eukprot:3918015-Pyramimonas_sp.AAC.1
MGPSLTHEVGLTKDLREQPPLKTIQILGTGGGDLIRAPLPQTQKLLIPIHATAHAEPEIQGLMQPHGVGGVDPPPSN